MASRNDGNVEVKLVDVRLSFPALFKAEVNENEDGTKTKKFKASFLLDKKTKVGKANIRAVEEAIEQAKEAKWPKGAPKLKDSKLCLRDGDQEDWDGYAGNMYVSAGNSKRPKVVNKDKSPLTEEDGVIFAGCRVNAIIRVWAQDNKHGKRINASLEAVQFYKDDEAFSGYKPVDTDEAFDDFSDEDDDDAPKKSKKRSRDDDDDDEDERPKKRRSRDDDDEDEDERPKKRRSRDDDDDEDERPAKKRKSRDDDDDDEDEKPKRKKRSRDDDDEDEDERPRKRRSRDEDEDED